MTRIVDLTHPFGLDANVPAGVSGPRLERLRTVAKDGRNSSRIDLAAHTGTHLDAPWHTIDNGLDIEGIGMDRLIGPAVVWSFPMGDEGRAIGGDDLARATPSLERGDAVLISTGWARRYGRPEYKQQRPWLTTTAAIWLRDHGARLVGIDFASPEQRPDISPPSPHFAVHHELLDHGVLIVENVADLSSIEGQRVRLFVAVVPVKDIDGFPARVFAEV
jgi:kynurenine formamidase